MHLFIEILRAVAVAKFCLLLLTFHPDAPIRSWTQQEGPCRKMPVRCAEDLTSVIWAGIHKYLLKTTNYFEVTMKLEGRSLENGGISVVTAFFKRSGGPMLGSVRPLLLALYGIESVRLTVPASLPIQTGQHNGICHFCYNHLHGADGGMACPHSSLCGHEQRISFGLSRLAVFFRGPKNSGDGLDLRTRHRMGTCSPISVQRWIASKKIAVMARYK